jgi:hypothetical protein
MLAQDVSALDERWSGERVEVGRVPARVWQVYASLAPAGLTVPPSIPVEGEARGGGEASGGS